MTALSLVFPVQNFINAAGIGFGVGMNAVISFYLGAKDYEKADMATTQGLLLSAVHGVLLTIVSIEIMPFFLRCTQFIRPMRDVCGRRIPFVAASVSFVGVFVQTWVSVLEYKHTKGNKKRGREKTWKRH